MFEHWPPTLTTFIPYSNFYTYQKKKKKKEKEKEKEKVLHVHIRKEEINYN